MTISCLLHSLTLCCTTKRQIKVQIKEAEISCHTSTARNMEIKEMDWSTTSNVENERVAFRPPPWLESNSSNSFRSFNYDPCAGNSSKAAYTQTGPVIHVPESEKIINANQCASNNNNEMIKKNKRLTSEQLASLEIRFKEEFRLDSERKLKLAKELGLQQRQVAVWFQNRRARWKVKHLEESYDSLRHEYAALWRETQMLHDEVKKLRAILRVRDPALMNSNQFAGENQIYGVGEYNSPMMVASSCWRPPMSQQPYP